VERERETALIYPIYKYLKLYIVTMMAAKLLSLPLTRAQKNGENNSWFKYTCAAKIDSNLVICKKNQRKKTNKTTKKPLTLCL
jgi:hypothetical protein